MKERIIIKVVENLKIGAKSTNFFYNMIFFQFLKYYKFTWHIIFENYIYCSTQTHIL